MIGVNISRWSRRVIPRAILFVALWVAIGRVGAAEPTAAAVRWPEIDPALRSEEAFGLKLQLVMYERKKEAGRKFVEEALARDPQPYVKAYAAWIGYFGRAWGLEPATDFTRVHSLATEAVAGGSVVGMDVLGRATAFGLGMPANAKESARLLTAAAAKGSMWATCQLGFYYVTGYGVPRDLAKGERLMRRAAELGGVTTNYYDLAVLYEKGEYGWPKDPMKEMECYYRAALCDGKLGSDRLEALGKQRVPEARLYRALARVHWANDDAKIEASDVREQVKVLEDIGQDSAAAQFELGTLYAEGEWVHRDIPRAQAHLNRAKAMGDRRANVTLARIRLYGWGVPRDVDGAVSDLALMAAFDNPDAAGCLGHLYYWGSSDVREMKEDEAKAFELTRVAAENGKVRALWDLARDYEHGIGVKKDYLVAASLYWLAYKRGFEDGGHQALRMFAWVKQP
jgi:TPR repeat protein